MIAGDEQARVQEVAERFAMTILQSQETVTDEIVDQAIQGALASIRAMASIYGDAQVDPERLRAYIERRVNVWAADGTTLSDNIDHEPWLDVERAFIEWRFWDRYRGYLTDRLPPAALRQIDRGTDEVLSLLESPRRQNAWDRRGMVVGQVQSGKTANYTGLVCKAADAGYRLIVVLAGMHDSLRSQTQERIDEGFLGWDTQYGLTHKDGSRSHRTGVGAMVVNSRLLPAATYTTSAAKGDFKKGVAQQVAPHVGSDPVILVVKKNKTILENVIAWTTREKVTDPVSGRDLVLGQPLIVIDDEADNASVNTKEVEREIDPDDGTLLSETDPATINRLIRKLLHSFQQSAYVGYTATPFANIFIFEDETHQTYGEDLFPRSFIRRIPPPSNYVGAPRVFGLPAAESPSGAEEPGLPVVRIVDDHDGFIANPTRKDEILGSTPASLREAVHAFVLSCAVRASRGEAAVHNSMLVHVTRFVDVQRQVVERLQDEMEGIRLRLRHGEGDRQQTLEAELRGLWERDFVPTTKLIPAQDCGSALSWDDVRPFLHEAASRIVVHTVNGTSSDALQYKDHRRTGLSVIAVGGDKLSRGLTLEGLTVSYYLRTSKMYDTLMQMGRWFGYRPGYLDVCRLYTTQELVDWYGDITVANEELNREFDAMAAANETPRDYGLRVRSHPEGLLITARAKMRNAREVHLSFAGTCPQTTGFDIDAGRQRENADHTERFLERQTKLHRYQGQPTGRDHRWTLVSGADVADFLEGFRFSAAARRVNGPLLKEYIAKAMRDGELTEWTISLLSRPERAADGPRFAGHRIGLIERAERTHREETFSIKAILSPAHELIDLDTGQRARALESTKRRFEEGRLVTRSGKTPREPDGIAAREQRDPRTGLLLLYPLEPGEKALDRDLPLVGVAVSFPKSKHHRTVAYRVNNVFWQQMGDGAIA